MDARSSAQFGKLSNHFIRFADSRLGLRSTRLRAAPQPLDFTADAVREGLLPLSLRVEKLFLHFEKPAVVSLHAKKAVRKQSVDLDDVGCEVLQKISIVTHHQTSERRRLKDCFQPLDACKVEMIRGFVKQQQVGVLNQSLDDRQTFAPAAGKSRCGRVEVGEARPPKRFRKPRRMFVFRNEPAVERRQGDAVDGGARRKVRVLFDNADARAFPDGRFSGIGVEDPGKNPQDGGLPGTIRSDHADPVPVVHREREVLEQRGDAETFG